MKFKIDKRIFEKFPELIIGVVVAKGIDNKGINNEIINFIKDEERKIRDNFNTQTLSQNPKINSWRKAYSSFGAKPKKYKCSVENLYRMILNGIDLKHINKIVDIYNYISIKHIIPVGGDDIDKIDGNIILKFAEGNEEFVELNSNETKNPKQGEVVYADKKDILCRRWNWRECDKTKMRPETKNIALVVEALPPVAKNQVEEIINELGNLTLKFCNGKINKFILDRTTQDINFD